MPVYEYQGQYYELSETDPAAAKRKILAHLGTPEAQPEGGFFPALRAGFEGLKGAGAALAGRTGLMDEAEAQAAYEAAQKRQREIFKPTEEGWTEAPLTKVKELLGGSLPYMAAPLAAGAAAATLPFTGTAAGVATLGAAGLASATQFTATNLARQLDTGKQLAETDLGAAALTAIPQAALDTLSLRLMPGVGRILGDAGIKVTKETAKEVSEQILKKAAIDYTATTGKAMGREGLTEAAQQALERLQAGLSLTDAEARNEYLESLIGGAVLGGAISPAGRYLERGRAERQVGEIEAAQQREQRQQAAAAEAARKQTPEYIEEKYTAYQDLLDQKNALTAQIKKGTKEAPLSQEDKDANAVVNKQLTTLQKPLESARQAYIAAGGPQAMAKLRAGRLELTPPPGRVTEPAATVEEEEAPEIASARAAQEVRGLTALLDQQRAAARDAETDEDAIAAAEQAQRTAQALQKAQDTLAKYPAAPDAAKLQKEVTALEKKFADARAKGDQDAVIKVGRELLEKRQQLRAYAPDTGLFAPEFDEERVRQELGEAMGRGREAAGYERQGMELEQEFAREQDARRAALAQQLEEEGAAEREALTERAAELAQATRARETGRVRTAPQLALFPEPRERVIRTAEGPRISGRQQMLREEIAELEKQRDAKEKSQEQGLAGTFARDPAQIADINRRIAAKRLELEELDFDTIETRRFPAPAEAPEADLAPRAKLPERVDTLAQQVLTSPAVDEETKALVAQVVDNLPAFRRDLPLLERFLYRARTGAARPDDIEDAGEIRRILDVAAEGRQSETETLPSGEIRRAVQLEIPLPEPKATAFESFDKFNDYLASEGLQAYRTQMGQVFPTLANLQRRFAPIQQRISELEKQLADVSAKRKALAQADETERADASALLREAQNNLQSTIANLDTLAQTTYVGKKLERVNLADMQRQAQQRVSDAVAHSANLREQFNENLARIDVAKSAAQEVGVDEQGRLTTDPKKEVRRVRLGQLPGYQALRDAQLDLQEKGLALVEADKKVEQVVKEGIGQSWDEGSPTLKAYLSAKKAKEEARRLAQQSHYKLIQANRRIPGAETLNQNLAKFLEQKATLDNEIARAAKSLSALRMGLRNASNRLNDAYVRMENIPDMRFGENLQRLRNDLLAAESISAETAQRSVARQAEREQLGKEGAALARPLRERREVISDVTRRAQERAKARQGVPPGETQADREARDGEIRRAEQARLERLEISEKAPRTLIQFEQTSERKLADETYTKLVERTYNDKLSSAERLDAAEKADAYLAQKAAKLAAEEEKSKGNAQKHENDLASAERKLAELTKKKEGLKLSRDETRKLKTPEERDARLKEKQQKIDAAIENQERLVEKHQRLRSASLLYPEVKRVDPAELKAYRERLNEEVLRGRTPGERLGARAIGPMTRPEVMPPKTMRTGSEESREGLTTTPSRNKITEARGEKQRDIPLRKQEMAEANRLAAELKSIKGVEDAEKLLAKEFKAAKERGLKDGELESFRDRQEILTKRKAALLDPRRPGAPLTEKTEEVKTTTAEQREAAAKEEKQVEKELRGKSTKKTREEELDALYAADEDFTPEILGGSREEAFYSRGATPDPSTTASVRAELKKAFPDLGRVQIYDSVDALVKANPQYEGKVPSDARGFVDTAGNKAFLIAENINQGQALSVLLHEVGSHIGLKNALGEAPYNALVNAVKSWEKKADGSTEAKVAQAARARVEAAETKASQVNDELLAYAIEEAVNAGVKPTQTKGVLGQWLGRVALLFRRALEKFGLPPKALDAQGIVDMAFGAAKMEMTGAPATSAKAPEVGELFFTRAADYSKSMREAGELADTMIGSMPSAVQRMKASLMGMGFRTAFVDKLTPVEAALKGAVEAGQLEDYKATQAMFFLRMYDQRSHFTSLAVTDGAPVLREVERSDGRKEFLIEAEQGAKLKDVVDILSRKDVVKAAGSAEAANKLFTMYDVAKRAERVGFEKLNLKDPKVTEDRLREVRAEIEADPVLKDAFDQARSAYNEYNKNLLHFVRDTGALSKELVDRLLRSEDYIPYYRVNPKGEVELVLGGEQSPVRVANLKDSPHLKELLGDDKPVLDFLTSSVQNTSMLLDMALKNVAQKNLAWEMSTAGLGQNFSVTYEKGGKTKRREIPDGALRYKLKGDDWFFMPDEAALGHLGVDAGLLMKGLEGIPTMFPTVMRLLGGPTRLLRRLVVASPPYMARQLIRDSLSAVMTSGANMTPVLSAIKQIGRKGALDARGIVGGQVFTGLPEDMTALLKQMQAGKPGWTRALAKLEATSMEIDAANRRAQYKSYLDQGLSEMEASYMALESMNFSKRGLSPSVHMVSQLIPFFNAQIQGLDVLYKSMTGKMPFNQRLDIKNKLYTRGILMAAGTLAYAAAMQDDEAYKNARPDEKYGNWFVRIPGVEEPVRVPIPFELGYIFKALPEALVNTIMNDKGAEEAQEAFSRIALNIVPGLSSFFLPQALKPAVEVGLGKSFFTGRDIESAREAAVEPFQRFRDNTTDAAKWIGSVFNISPIKLEYLIRGYTSSLGMAMLAALNPAFPDVMAPGAPRRASEYPLVGGFFQPNDAGGIIDATFKRMKEVQQIQATYKDMLAKQGPDAATKYATENADALAGASLAGAFRQQMGDLARQAREVRASQTLTPERKRELLDLIKQLQIKLATSVRERLDRTTPQAARA